MHPRLVYVEKSVYKAYLVEFHDYTVDDIVPGNKERLFMNRVKRLE